MVLPISIWTRGMINCFLIKGRQKHILVDTGVPGSESRILRQISQYGINQEDIALIVVTHGHIDHFGSASALQDILGAPVLVHKYDQKAYESGSADITTMNLNKPEWWLFKQVIKDQKADPFTADILLGDGEEYSLTKWGIDGKVIHTPGHTPGSLSVVLDNGEVIIMDMMASGILLGGLLFHRRIKHPPFHDDLSELKRSFSKILSRQGERFYLGHGGPVNRQEVLKYQNKYLK